MGENFRRVVALSHAPLVKILPADDLLEPDCLATQVAALDADADLALVVGRKHLVDEHGTVLARSRFVRRLAGPHGRAAVVRRVVRSGANPIGANAAGTFRRDRYLAAGGYGDDPALSDLELWLRLLHHGRFLGPDGDRRPVPGRRARRVRAGPPRRLPRPAGLHDGARRRRPRCGPTARRRPRPPARPAGPAAARRALPRRPPHRTPRRVGREPGRCAMTMALPLVLLVPPEPGAAAARHRVPAAPRPTPRRGARSATRVRRAASRSCSGRRPWPCCPPPRPAPTSARSAASGSPGSSPSRPGPRSASPSPPASSSCSARPRPPGCWAGSPRSWRCARPGSPRSWSPPRGCRWRGCTPGSSTRSRPPVGSRPASTRASAGPGSSRSGRGFARTMVVVVAYLVQLVYCCCLVKPDQIEVSVADTGVGMSAAVQERIFRLDSKHTTPGTHNEKGTGLGLMLCKEFVERLRRGPYLGSKPGKPGKYVYVCHSQLGFGNKTARRASTGKKK